MTDTYMSAGGRRRGEEEEGEETTEKRRRKRNVKYCNIANGYTNNQTFQTVETEKKTRKFEKKNSF